MSKSTDVLDIAIGAISTQLDAHVVSRAVTRAAPISFLPNAENYPIVDFAVRAWATLHKASIETEPARVHVECGVRYVIAVYRVRLGYDAVVTVHRPLELVRNDELPKPVGDASAAWSPAHGGAQ
jgi:hypothetical protein